MDSKGARRLRDQSIPPAFVVWWNESNVSVLCPYCCGIHHHDIQLIERDESGGLIYNPPGPDRLESQAARCDIQHMRMLDVKYDILFPYQKDWRVRGLSFEIEARPNPKDYRFRTVGFDETQIPALYHSDDEERGKRISNRDTDDLALDFGEQLKLGDDEITNNSAAKLFWKACREGDLVHIKNILHNDGKSTMLVRNRDTNGLSGFHFAILHGHIEVAEFLLDRGSDINCSDAKGRTPLMKAALRGHARNVQFLLEVGADATKQDSQGMSAMDLATKSEVDDEERSKPARPGEPGEDKTIQRAKHGSSFDRKQRLRAIRCLLEAHTKPIPTAGVASLDLNDASYYKSDLAESASLVIPARGISISNPFKTVAFLNRGWPFPIVFAVSGWTGSGKTQYGPKEGGFQKLDTAFWKPESLKVAKELGFDFARDYRDRQEPHGSYNASHAEIQLITYYLQRNVLFREHGIGEFASEEFFFLAGKQLFNKHVQILVAHENGACKECERFAKKVAEITGISFDLMPLKELKQLK